MNQRQQQVASSLQRNISQVLARKISDPRLSGLISITRVEVSADLKQASVYVSIVPAQRERLAMEGLRSASRHIRREVGELVRLRTLPELTFKIDRTLKKEAEVLEAIRAGMSEYEDAEAESATDAESEEETTDQRASDVDASAPSAGLSPDEFQERPR